MEELLLNSLREMISNFLCTCHNIGHKLGDLIIRNKELCKSSDNKSDIIVIIIMNGPAKVKCHTVEIMSVW